MSNTVSYKEWPVIYLWIATVFVAGATFVGYTQPNLLIGSWRAIGAEGALDLGGPVGMWMSRNVATVGVGLFALLLRSRDMIIAMLVFRVFVDLFDTIHWGVVSGQVTMGIVPLVMTLIAAAGAYQMWKTRQA